MNNLLKGISLALFLTVPATVASAQSVATEAYASAATFATGNNMLALLETEVPSNAIENNSFAPVAAPSQPAETTKSMSEELSGWVENKLAVVNAAKGLKRLK